MPVPGPGEVLIQLAAAGVNPVETYKRSGLYAALPPLPWVPGADGSGVVVGLGGSAGGGSSSGGGAPELSLGQTVWLSGSVSGTYATHCLAKATDAHPLPPAFEGDDKLASGAAIGTAYLTAWRALTVRRRRPTNDGAGGGVNIGTEDASDTK
jgi:NADPH2:quinone reductase